MPGSKFQIGDKVRKIKGYPFVGTVCAVYADQEKCCVKHKDQWEHIFSDSQLAFDHPEYQYLDLLKEVLEDGHFREGRNGGVRSMFGRQIRFDISDNIPVLTTKKIHLKSVVGELLWFLTGDTHVKYLKDNGITIWDEWADYNMSPNGHVGNLYGAQWRYWIAPSKVSHIKGMCSFGTIDQIQNVIDSLKTDPYGRRHVVSAWNPDDVNKSVLPPCHILFQFYIDKNERLSCQLYQRSADIFLGVPFNIASYSILTHLIAREIGRQPGEFVHTFGDLHLYENHVEAAKEQLTRTPMPFPRMSVDTDLPLDQLGLDHIKFHHYNSHPTIKAPVSK